MTQVIGMARLERPAGEPVLVDRVEAREILNVTDATFARLCREGRFENMVCAGRHALYRSVELRAYRAQDKRRGASPGSITNAAERPSKSALVRGKPWGRPITPGRFVRGARSRTVPIEPGSECVRQRADSAHGELGGQPPDRTSSASPTDLERPGTQLGAGRPGVGSAASSLDARSRGWCHRGRIR